MVSAYLKCRSISFRSSLANMRDWWHGHSLFAGRISRSDPPLAAISTAYPAEPFLTVFHPPIELARLRPGGRLHMHRRLDFPAICLSALARIKIFGGHASNLSNAASICDSVARSAYRVVRTGRQSLRVAWTSSTPLADSVT
jgi:hypothetical protein